MNLCDDTDCLPNRILAKVVGHIIPDNYGICIHLDNNKFVVSVFDGKVHVEDANDYDYEDYQPLEVSNDTIN